MFAPLLLACHACSTCLLAPRPTDQDPDARPLIGRAVDPDGDPIAGATVRVIWNDHSHPDLAPAGHSTATTSEAGVFVASAPEGIPLYAWFVAAGPQERWFSPIVRCATGRERLEIVAHEQAPERARTLRIEGLEAWRELAPFSLRIRPEQRASFEFEVAIDDGVATLPALPWSYARYRLLDRSEEPLLVWDDGPRDEPAALRVPAPRALPVRVEDTAGAPIGGAFVFYCASRPALRYGMGEPEPCGDWRLQRAPGAGDKRRAGDAHTLQVGTANRARGLSRISELQLARRTAAG